MTCYFIAFEHHGQELNLSSGQTWVWNPVPHLNNLCLLSSQGCCEGYQGEVHNEMHIINDECCSNPLNHCILIVIFNKKDVNMLYNFR